jgi:nucleotide-binding universal stress UspA family protein
MWQNYLLRYVEDALMEFVVCIDGKESGFDVLDHAANIATGLGGSITLVHSVRPEVKTQNGELIQQSPEAAVDAGQSLLDRAADQLESNGIETEAVVLSDSDPITGVLDFATSHNVDGIFIGHRALTGRHETLFGSFAKNLISNSPIPVTVVSAATYNRK